MPRIPVLNLLRVLIGLVAVAPLLAFGSPPANETYRIGVVDPNRVVESSPQYEAAGRALQGEVEDRERNLREQQDQVAELQRKLERDGDLMSENEMQRLRMSFFSRWTGPRI